MTIKIIDSLPLLVVMVCMYIIFFVEQKINVDQYTQADIENQKKLNYSSDVVKKTYEVIWYTDAAPTLFKTDKLRTALDYIITYREYHEMYLKITDDEASWTLYVPTNEVGQLSFD